MFITTAMSNVPLAPVMSRVHYTGLKDGASGQFTMLAVHVYWARMPLMRCSGLGDDGDAVHPSFCAVQDSFATVSDSQSIRSHLGLMRRYVK